MHFVLQTALLQHLAGVKTVTCLWNQRNIFTQIEETINNFPAFKPNQYFKQKWKEIEENVKCKVWALPLPQTIKKQLLNFIKPIGLEIFQWCGYHNLNGNSFQFFGSLLPQQFCWSMHGTIDYAKTANIMVKDERLSVEKRFEFASLNCLEDEGAMLLELLPNHRIHKYISEAVGYGKRDPRILIAYFACALSGDEDLLDRLFQAMDIQCVSVNEHLFQVVLNNGPRATCEYFFHKVNHEDKERMYSSLPFRPTRSPTCGWMYWLSLINEAHDKEERMFQGDISSLLTPLLCWPMQSLFMETTTRVWQLMDSDDCIDVLYQLNCKISDGFEDYHYAQWFWELWRLSPAEHKRNFLDDTHQIADLITTKRKEFIQLVFNEAPPHLLKELVDIKYTYDQISHVLMDEEVISEAELMEYKQTAALKSLKDEDNVEKRLRSQHLSRLIDMVIKSRIKSREKVGLTTS